MKVKKGVVHGLVIILATAAIAGGCVSELNKHSAPSSLPVTLGAATTNDSPVVAYAKLAQSGNASFNPTPTEPLINTALGAFISLCGALSGYYAHRSATNTNQQRKDA